MCHACVNDMLSMAHLDTQQVTILVITSMTGFKRCGPQLKLDEGDVKFMSDIGKGNFFHMIKRKARKYQWK